MFHKLKLPNFDEIYSKDKSKPLHSFNPEEQKNKPVVNDEEAIHFLQDILNKTQPAEVLNENHGNQHSTLSDEDLLNEKNPNLNTSIVQNNQEEIKPTHELDVSELPIPKPITATTKQENRNPNKSNENKQNKEINHNKSKQHKEEKHKNKKQNNFNKKNFHNVNVQPIEEKKDTSNHGLAKNKELKPDIVHKEELSEPNPINPMEGNQKVEDTWDIEDFNELENIENMDILNRDEEIFQQNQNDPANIDDIDPTISWFEDTQSHFKENEEETDIVDEIDPTSDLQHHEPEFSENENQHSINTDNNNSFVQYSESLNVETDNKPAKEEMIHKDTNSVQNAVKNKEDIAEENDHSEEHEHASAINNETSSSLMVVEQSNQENEQPTSEDGWGEEDLSQLENIEVQNGEEQDDYIPDIQKEQQEESDSIPFDYDPTEAWNNEFTQIENSTHTEEENDFYDPTENSVPFTETQSIENNNQSVEDKPSLLKETTTDQNIPVITINNEKIQEEDDKTIHSDLSVVSHIEEQKTKIEVQETSIQVNENKTIIDDKQEIINQPSIIEDPRTIIKNASKKWNMIIPKSNAEKKEIPLFNDIIFSLQRKIIPVKLNPNNIEAFTRYKGAPIGIVYRPLTLKYHYTLFALADNPIKLHVFIKRISEPSYNYYYNLVLEEEFTEFFSVQITGQHDVELANQIIDIFIQKNLVEISPFLKDGDEVIINRSGIFMNVHNFRNAYELEQTLSLFFLLSQNLKMASNYK